LLRVNPNSGAWRLERLLWIWHHILVNLLTLPAAAICLADADEMVFKRSAGGGMMMHSTMYYAWLAYRLAKRTGRNDVRAAIGHQRAAYVHCDAGDHAAGETGDGRPGEGWQAGWSGVYSSFVLMGGGFWHR